MKMKKPIRFFAAIIVMLILISALSIPAFAEEGLSEATRSGISTALEILTLLLAIIAIPIAILLYIVFFIIHILYSIVLFILGIFGISGAAFLFFI